MIPLKDTIPSREKPFMTWLLILINVFVFLHQVSLPPELAQQFVYKYGFVPDRFTYYLQHGILTAISVSTSSILTSMFLHGSWMHLISNMWSLWLFGDNVEDRVGHFKFLIFYILSGISASLTHWFFNATSDIPTVGASGAISGVMGAYFLMFPLSRIVTLIPLGFIPLFIEIPALFYLGIWFLSQVSSGILELFGPVFGSGIAWWAHIGGFLFGMFTINFFKKKYRRYNNFFDDEIFFYRYY
ncbi:rhomboid family intramembrane serine protease [Caldicellulosiruptor naganoensis]|uniref:Rhomboid family intramembrane serine protease n=1 Tax=Caldicellulosiruptor naganoensis TaxID=29324 RepID=A0ABY7BFJ6_9FIRM|nr:rhomboid family intramembrane serine protease [Caldicellulosiruptor naganoensis]WAM31583.1 rhomboid family intramembrane serine protease [Caldicellulosiruptor naganoensis]